MKKKLALRENFNDFDRYYLRAGRSINEEAFKVYYTPLHEAVLQGHLESVQLLCNAGADQDKKIEASSATKKIDMAAESKNLSVFWISYLTAMKKKEAKDEINEFHSTMGVGLSATGLAQKLMEEKDSPERKAIHEFLKKHQ